jgi:hypothetical protein
MRLKHEDNIVLSNTTNEKKFTIAASAKAFRILSDGLYSRKIEAIVRELSCNAYDAHVMAGCPEKPFVVHLPNTWTPEFSVEDFGIGLDGDDVENIYTSYFTSTKTDSNDVIGALGLGSKTPFSYTDSFNIRARKDGIERIYNAYISASGEPSVSMLSAAPTEMGNGVKITVPVRTADFNQFYYDTQTVYKWFVTTPTFEGREMSVNNEMAKRLLDEEYFISKTHNRNIVVAVMGNVAYTVSNVNETFSDDLTEAEKNYFNNNSLVIKFDIGDLDVAASRETLSFDEDTKEVFITKLKTIISNYATIIQAKIDDEASSVFSAINIVEREVGLWALGLFTYNGKDLYNLSTTSVIDSINIILSYTDDVGEEKYIMRNDVFTSRNSRTQYQDHNYIYNDTYRKYSNRKQILNIVQGDKNKGYKRAARTLHDSNYPINLYTVITTENVTQPMLDALHEMFGEDGVLVYDVDKLIEKYRLERKAERDRIRALNPTAKAVVAPKVRVKKEQIRSELYEIGDDGKIVHREESVYDVDYFEGKTYAVIPHKRGTIDDNDNLYYMMNSTSINTTSMYMFHKLMNIDVIVVVPSVKYERTKTLLPKGVDVIDRIKNCKVDYGYFVDMMVFVNSYIEREFIIKFDEDGYEELTAYDELVCGQVINSKFCRSYKNIIERIESNNHMNSYSIKEYFSNRFLKSANTFSNRIVEELQKEVKQIKESVCVDFPMLQFVGNHSRIEYDSEIREYIELVKKSRSNSEETDVEYSQAA